VSLDLPAFAAELLRDGRVARLGWRKKMISYLIGSSPVLPKSSDTCPHCPSVARLNA